MEHLDRTMPIGLHGDGGGFTKADSLFVLSWNGLLGAIDNKGFGRRWLYTVVRKRDMTDETMAELLRVFCWSTNILLTGITPERNWDDKPYANAGRFIANGFRGVFMQLRGDWEFYANTLHFPNWANNGNMYWFCGAEGIGELH